MATRGAFANTEELQVLRLHTASALAGAAGVNRRTAERAKAGEPVLPLCLRALLDAARRLSASSSVAATTTEVA